MIGSRDGLLSLYESGSVEKPEYEAGLMYRRCFETLSHSDTGFAELRTMRAEQLARWEALAGTGRQLWVLRLVAGQGRAVNSLGAGGAARLANTKALVEVLRAIAMERGLRQ